MEQTKTTTWKVVKLPNGKYTLRRQVKVITIMDDWWPKYVTEGATWSSRNLAQETADYENGKTAVPF
ncbi:hypothetical protein [Acidaminococcus sp.]|uniref:hypothetical protein n=1 Tax=Acidaminococcus sp. TaxID=1872103 RepID=UPI003D7C9C11